MPLHDTQLRQLLHAIEAIADGITVTATEDLTKIGGIAVVQASAAGGSLSVGGNQVTNSNVSTNVYPTLIAGSDYAGTPKIQNIKSDSSGKLYVSTVDTISTLTNGNVGGFTTLVQSTIVMSVAGAYATGDYMGTTTTPQSFSSVVRTSGGTGIIKSILISDKIVTTNVAMELWIIDRTFTAPTDNAAWDLSDANMLFVQAVIPIATTGWYASSAGQVYFDGTLSYPIKSNGTTLFYALVARGTTPAFTSSDLTITLGVLQD